MILTLNLYTSPVAMTLIVGPMLYHAYDMQPYEDGYSVFLRRV